MTARRGALGWALLGLMLVSCGREAPRAPAARPRCAFTPPAVFDGRPAKWDGECVAGKAQGRGVLHGYAKPTDSDNRELTFFGTLQAGEPALGVVETRDGYLAGEFVRGALRKTDDRETFIRAFEEAAQAARSLSERLKKAGDAASAQIYERKADQLLKQMD